MTQTHRRGGDVKTEAETGVMQPQAEEYQKPPEAGESQGTDSPAEPLEEMQP